MALEDDDGAGVTSPDKKRDSKSTETKGKAKAAGKSKGSGGAHGKKAKKGSKKAKAEDDIELDYEIVRSRDSPGCNLFLPDRTSM